MNTKKKSESDIAAKLELHQSPSHKWGLRRWLVIAVIAVCAIAAVTALLGRKGGAQRMQFKTEKATHGDLKVIVTATGTLQPTNEVEVGSELSGIVKSVGVDYNDKVKVGQVLARLDPTKLSAQVTQLKSALESAKARVLQAQVTVKETQSKYDQFKKVWELSEKKVPSQTDINAAEAAFERAKADEASAQADISQAQATLTAYQTDLSKLVITSPITGIVLTRKIEPGQTVAASFTAPVLFTLAEDLTKMELHVNVDEADIGKVKEGQEAEFTVAAYTNRTFQAVIIQTRFSSSTTSGVVTYETVLRVDNSKLLLRPGMTATADIMVQKVENALLVPVAALRYSPPMPTMSPGKKGAPSRGLVGSLLPGPPKRDMNKMPPEPVNSKTGQRVWALENGMPRPIPVITGATDGALTVIDSGDVKPGTVLIIDSQNPEQ
jgi:HlyD family secretion protein